MRMSNQEAINILLNEQKCINRNDGTQCDRKCESCDLVMDAEQIREAYSMAISALEAQDAPDTNVDTISRQAAIDAIEKNAYRHTYLDQIIDIVSELPSAQPDFDIKATIDKAYDDGYEAGYLQGRYDWGDLI